MSRQKLASVLLVSFFLIPSPVVLSKEPPPVIAVPVVVPPAQPQPKPNEWYETKARIVKGRLELEYHVSVPTKIRFTVRERERGEEFERETTVHVPEVRVKQIAAGGFRVLDPRCKPLGPMDAEQRLREKTKVYHRRNNEPPTAEELKKLPPDAIFVIESKPAAAPQESPN